VRPLPTGPLRRRAPVPAGISFSVLIHCDNPLKHLHFSRMVADEWAIHAMIGVYSKQRGLARAAAFLVETVARAAWPSELWSSFVDYVEGCFRSSAETIEPGGGHDLPNARLAGLCA
jgi:hypothetical protein